MFVTKDLSNKIFDYIDLWGENLSLISWAVRASHNSTLNKTPAQIVFSRDVIFNLSSVADRQEITLRK